MFMAGAYYTGETARATLFIYPFILLTLGHAESIMIKNILLFAGVQTCIMQLSGSYFW